MSAGVGDVWGMLREVRTGLAEDTLAGLSPEQWETQSLCEQWRVRDVVAHLVQIATLGQSQWLMIVVRSGFRPHRGNGQVVRQRGESATPEELEGEGEGVLASRL